MESLKPTVVSDKYSNQIIQRQINDIKEDKQNGILSPSDILDYGKETLSELLQEGYPIVFSVPAQFKDKVKTDGLTLHETDIPGFKALAGTIGTQPYQPEDEPRLLAILRAELAKQYKIKPRFTGSESIFQGVIITENPIPASDLEFIDTNISSKEVSDIQTNIKDSITKLAS